MPTRPYRRTALTPHFTLVRRRAVTNVLPRDISGASSRALVERRRSWSSGAARSLTPRAHVAARRPRGVTSPAKTDAALEAFQRAVETGELQSLLDILAPDVVTLTDGGGVKQAWLRPIVGAGKVTTASRNRPYAQTGNFRSPQLHRGAGQASKSSQPHDRARRDELVSRTCRPQAAMAYTPAPRHGCTPGRCWGRAASRRDGAAQIRCGRPPDRPGSPGSPLVPFAGRPVPWRTRPGGPLHAQ